MNNALLYPNFRIGPQNEEAKAHRPQPDMHFHKRIKKNYGKKASANSNLSPRMGELRCCAILPQINPKHVQIPQRQNMHQVCGGEPKRSLSKDYSRWKRWQNSESGTKKPSDRTGVNTVQAEPLLQEICAAQLQNLEKKEGLKNVLLSADYSTGQSLGISESLPRAANSREREIGMRARNKFYQEGLEQNMSEDVDKFRKCEMRDLRKTKLQLFSFNGKRLAGFYTDLSFERPELILYSMANGEYKEYVSQPPGLKEYFEFAVKEEFKASQTPMISSQEKEETGGNNEENQDLKVEESLAKVETRKSDLVFSERLNVLGQNIRGSGGVQFKKERIRNNMRPQYKEHVLSLLLSNYTQMEEKKISLIPKLVDINIDKLGSISIYLRRSDPDPDLKIEKSISGTIQSKKISPIKTIIK